MKTILATAVTVFAASLFADQSPTVFPYTTTERNFYAASMTLAGAVTNVPCTSEMPAGNNVAELSVASSAITAIDSSEWSDYTSGITGKAALALKDDSGTLSWQALSGGSWVTLTGVAPTEAEHSINIDFDYSKAPAVIRYKVDGTALENASHDTWIAPGDSSAAKVTEVSFNGYGTVNATELKSGLRGAYADLTFADETIAFDYSSVAFKVHVGNDIYGDQLKVTLTDSQGNQTYVQQTITAGQDCNVDFSSANLAPGRTYTCSFEVTKGGTSAPWSTGTPAEVVLANDAGWFGFGGGVLTNASLNANGQISENRIVAVDDESVVDVTPGSAAQENTVITVDTVVDYTNFAETGDISGTSPQGAVALTSDGWKCYVDGGWLAVSHASIPTAAGTYTVRAEFDYAAASKVVSYSVKVGNSFYRLANNETVWFALPSGKTRLEKTSFLGGGAVSAIVANYNSILPVSVPEVDAGTIKVAGSTDIDLSRIGAATYGIASKDPGKKYSLRWSDNGGKSAKIVDGQLVVMDKSPANGIASYDSYVLGLDTESAASVPVLDAPQNADSTKVDFKVLNVVPKTDAAEVTFELKSSTAPDGTFTTIDSSADGALSDSTLPSSGARYYKVDIQIRTK